MITRFLIGFFLTWTVASLQLLAIPTDIIVRVKSKDAKFIGSSMGGVLITIKNMDTGELLAKGVTAGTTGDTKVIMDSSHPRGSFISDDRSAKFVATMDIDEPTFIEVTAIGPMAQRQSANRVSQTQWILPGKHITVGDAVLLELPGFVVDVLSPPAHIKYGGAPKVVKIKANVTMMCGCPVRPNGIWDSNKFIIETVVKKDHKNIEVIRMNYAGESSQFSCDYTALESGTYEAIIYAFDETTGNTGLDRTTFLIK